jgi:hypothetical protein
MAIAIDEARFARIPLRWADVRDIPPEPRWREER